MRNRRLYTKLAVEEIAAAAVDPTAEVETAPVEAGADSLEADLVEVNTDIVEIGEDEAAVEEASDVVEELEVVAESLRIVAQNGGLDRNGAQVLNLYRASLNKRLGEDETKHTLSQESFGLTNSRAGATSLAAESIAEQAKEVWGKIVEMFRKALAAIVSVWKRIFDGATRLKARAEGIAKNAAGAKAEAGATEFENDKLASNLHLSGVIDVKKAAAAVAAEASILSTITKASIEFANHANTIVESGDVAKLPELAKSTHGAVSQGFSKVTDGASVGLGNPGEGLELFKSEELPGNKAVIAILPTDGASTNAIGKTSYKLGTFDASKKVSEKAKLPVLSTSDIQAVAKTIAGAADSLISYQRLQKDAEAAAKKVIALAEKKAKETTKAHHEGEGKDTPLSGKIGQRIMAGADERSLAKGAMAIVVNAAPPLAAFVLNAGGYVLQYAEQSLKQYGKVKEEKKPEEAAAAAA